MPKGIYARKPRTPKQYPPELVAKVAQMYSDGHTQTEIGLEVGLTQRVIWRLMSHHGIPARVAAKREQRGAANSYWKGDNAGYCAFHRRLDVAKGRPKLCEVCGTTAPGKWYDWANLTGAYDDPADFKRMCRSCHRGYDNARRKGEVRNVR